MPTTFGFWYCTEDIWHRFGITPLLGERLILSSGHVERGTKTDDYERKSAQLRGS